MKIIMRPSLNTMTKASYCVIKKKLKKVSLRLKKHAAGSEKIIDHPMIKLIDMKKIIIAILSLCLGAEVSAQQDDAFKELQKIRAYYDGPELKHIAGQMLLTNKNNSKAIDKVDFEYWIKEKR